MTGILKRENAITITVKYSTVLLHITSPICCARGIAPSDYDIAKSMPKMPEVCTLVPYRKQLLPVADVNFEDCRISRLRKDANKPWTEKSFSGV